MEDYILISFSRDQGFAVFFIRSKGQSLFHGNKFGFFAVTY
jgi:hypothetical protein